jgi:Oxidoreductase molybdopterin binding domain
MICAKWGGVKILGVLKHCGLDVDVMALGEKTPDNIKHLQLKDTIPTRSLLLRSIPIDKAVDGLGDFLVAHEMQGP